MDGRGRGERDRSGEKGLRERSRRGARRDRLGVSGSSGSEVEQVGPVVHDISLEEMLLHELNHAAQHLVSVLC